MNLVIRDGFRDLEDLRESRLLNFFASSEERFDKGVNNAGLYELAYTHGGERLEHESPHLGKVLLTRSTPGATFNSLINQSRAILFEEQSH